jgi:hypothetical protein
MDCVDTSDNLCIQNEMIDKVTLELLMNKNHYQRYIAQNDPIKHDEYMKYNALIKKYKQQIINITNELLSSPTKQITIDVNEAYNNYVKTLIKHFQAKEFENKPNHTDSDEDVLFGNMDETDNIIDADTNGDTEDDNIESQPIMKSFWGGNHVVKQKYKGISNYDMNLFSKNK